MNSPLTYKDAGVDMQAGDDLVDAIKPMAKCTMRPGVLAGIGGFGAMFFWFDGRVSLDSFFSNSRIKTISIVFLIFLLLVWLSS